MSCMSKQRIKASFGPDYLLFVCFLRLPSLRGRYCTIFIMQMTSLVLTKQFQIDSFKGHVSGRVETLSKSWFAILGCK